ncbi:PQQ-binding-like beta-propeller repeat protein [Melittangium boletus]|uniref:Uncharacterized protein n=1 Tax=Melittangium boletus DSM 14713 TaxID=1294270 RepID=A0A286NUU3_9BACT|nr:PQQ-binding-like beta-propeller repeat protein [Melittangium boletus]ATB26774.1 hypothetical protein MEBOL_000208 [Melittangium boletus DSM 14713]
MSVRVQRALGAMVLLGVFADCSSPGTCEQDSDCAHPGQYCHSEHKQCYATRYSALRVVTPEGALARSGGEVAFEVQLELNPGTDALYPPRLDFTATRAEGGSPVALTQREASNGKYSAVWTVPPEEGEYILRAVVPEEQRSRSAEVRVTVDHTAPTLELQVPEAQPPAAQEGFSFVDPKTDQAWRRDQVVNVRIQSDESAPPRVVVRGHNGGEDVTDLSVTPVTPCSGGCFTVAVPMWRPGLPDFRGNFQLEVSTKDPAGNERTVSARLPVTRWKWAFDGKSGPIIASPALGEKGTIYFGTNSATGRFFALNPEGTKKWEAQLGPVTSSPAVGEAGSAGERIYVGTSDSGSGVFFALDSKGHTLARCLESSSVTLGPINTAVAITHTLFNQDTVPVETAYTFANTNEAATLALRIDSSQAEGRCMGLSSGQNTRPGASMVVKGIWTYYGSVGRGDVDAIGVTPTAMSAKPAFALILRRTPVVGLAFTQGGGRLVGASEPGSTATSGGLFQADPENGGSEKLKDPFDGVGSVRQLTVGPGNTLFFGREVSSGTAPLTALDFASQTHRSVMEAGSFAGAVVLGSAGTLYAASASGASGELGEVSAWATDSLQPRWKLSDSVGRAQGSPSLDCSRTPEGTATRTPHGVLYVPSVNGQLYAFVVDSPGLDKTAPWPKYQHDARNTGNPDMPITNCP